uniref:Aminotransferase class I/classII domain-containing protein n=1 Tax=Panagrolaimus sp. ES5 TaxID=591445 RepID=A0AC34F447_9BILA
MALSSNFLRPDLENYKTAANLAYNNLIKELIAGGRKIYHFGFGESPFPVPQAFQQGLIEAADRNEYLSVEGLLDLRREILAFHSRYGDFDHFTVDDFVMGAGSKTIIYHVMSVFGGEIILFSPSWTSYLPQTQLSGKKAHIIFPSDTKRYIPSTEDIEKELKKCDPNIRKILVLNSPNNPTGITYTEDEIKNIADLCRKYKIIVLSDEIYARLSFTKFTSIAKYYPEGTIVLTGFSKWASIGGWRAGYALFPKELHSLKNAVSSAGSHSYTCLPTPIQYALLKELHSLKNAVSSAGSHSYTCLPTPIQYALLKGLQKSEELDEYIAKCKKVLSFAGKYTYRKLHDAGVEVHESESSYYCMPNFSNCRTLGVFDGQQLCDKFLEQGNVAFQPCDPHFLRPIGELTTRLSFVNFKGEAALNSIELKKEYNEKEQKEFLIKYCPTLIEGIQALADCVQLFKIEKIIDNASS